MRLAANSNKEKRNGGARRERGTVIPFVVIGLPALVAFMAFSMDLTRTAITTNKLQFAADSAALYMYGFGARKDASGLQQGDILAAMDDVNGAGSKPWHRAPVGPKGDHTDTKWEDDVTFSGGDVQYVANPADSTELLLRVTARRDGDNALQYFFYPLVRAFGAVTGETQTLERYGSPYRIAEVIGQPAARIGAAPPKTQAGPRSFAGYATFPLAISNDQFRNAVNTSTNPFTVRLVNSATAAGAAQPNELLGAFVNDAKSLSGGQYHGEGAGHLAIDQLRDLISYFDAVTESREHRPQAVERGNGLRAFDPADAAFTARKQELINAISNIPVGHFYIIPVVKGNPLFGNQPNEVVGFAWAKLINTVTPGKTDFDIRLELHESLPARNATAAAASVTIPSPNGTLMPAPVVPFVNRNLQSDDSISPRVRGVVLAPTLSPRRTAPLPS